ncbi:TPA: FAD-dependent oxidoreductase [Candidatus Poribacteria bacterium]|nr:FAD-dependent oxidoreductase [Candidatus Poribacteria bacterium]
MIIALILLGALGIIFGVFLAVASKVFYVWEDPKISEVREELAGANCGACGFAGCDAAAVAIASRRAEPDICVAGGQEVAEAVAAVMGLAVGVKEPILAESFCYGGLRARERYRYTGIMDCRAAYQLFHGEKDCEIGCLGFGTCVRSCPFDAITMGKEGFPLFNPEKCRGCGNCEEACPKGIISVISSSTKILRFNQEEDCLAPCRQACPAQIDIPRYIEYIKDGRYEDAIKTLKERNPFILSCGRVCPQPCEDICRRAIKDEPLAINQLKRFVADYEMNTGHHVPVTVAPDTGHKIAVIGGGPAGLSCAYFLRRLGHSVTIFEQNPKLGGMLYYGIPEYRLPKKILDWEIQGILGIGIEAKTEVEFGKDIDLESLIADGYEAVFISVGAWNNTTLRLEGEDTIEGVIGGIEFLGRQGLGLPNPVGERVGVIGGGNTAIDSARTALRLGAKEVTIIYRRTRLEMPANYEEIKAAEAEGINFLFLASPNRLISDENGKLTHLEYLKMELGEPDESGRRRPIPIEGSETILPLDNLIVAIGQYSDFSFIESDEGFKDVALTRYNTIDGDENTGQSNIPYIFVGGDALTGPGLAVEAIGSGRQAARAIHLYVTGQEVTAPPNRLRGFIEGTIFDMPYVVDILERTEPHKRVRHHELEVSERIDSMVEVDQTISEEEAREEASRCLKCGLTCFGTIVYGVEREAKEKRVA